MKIPEKAYNHETGKMEDTNLPHWQEYYKKLQEHFEYYSALEPKPQEFKDESEYRTAYAQWDINRFCNAPNKPGYYRANND